MSTTSIWPETWPEELWQWANYAFHGLIALIVWIIAIVVIGFLCLGIVKALLYIPFRKPLKPRTSQSTRYSDCVCNIMCAVMALLVIAATVAIALLAYYLSSIATAIIYVILITIFIIALFKIH